MGKGKQSKPSSGTVEQLNNDELSDVLGGVGNTNLPLRDERYKPHNMIKLGKKENQK